MKVFDLCCEQQHQFEGWFSSAEDFERQQENLLIECPMCGSRQVKKLLSAPRLNLSHGSSSAGETVGARGEKAARSGPVTAEIRELQGQLMRGLRKLIDATEDVGDRFAEEARRIHFDEAPDRPIRGVATPEETKALHEEGIEVLTLPLPPALKGRLQ